MESSWFVNLAKVLAWPGALVIALVMFRKVLSRDGGPLDRLRRFKMAGAEVEVAPRLADVHERRRQARTPSYSSTDAELDGSELLNALRVAAHVELKAAMRLQDCLASPVKALMAAEASLRTTLRILAISAAFRSHDEGILEPAKVARDEGYVSESEYELIELMEGLIEDVTSSGGEYKPKGIFVWVQACAMVEANIRVAIREIELQESGGANGKTRVPPP